MTFSHRAPHNCNTMTSQYRIIDKSSQESMMSELDVFNPGFSKTSVRDGEVFELPPEIHPNGLSPLTFEITGNSTFYIDLSNTLLHLQCKIMKQDGTKLTDTATDVKITHVTNLLHSMISNIKIYMNQKEIESNPNYAYKAYLSTILNHGSDAKNSHLLAAKWINDDMEEEHAANFSGSQTAKMKARAAVLAGSKTLDMIGRPITPLFSQGQYLIPGLNLRIEIEFNNPRSLLQNVEKDLTTEYKIDIVKAALLVRRLQVHPTIAASHAKMLDDGRKAKYAINRTDVQFYTISPGRQNQNITLINNKQEAKIIILGLIDHTAKNGSYDHSPFKFENFGLSSINIMVNGSYVLKKPLQLDFENDIYIRAYMNLLSVSGKSLTDAGNNISLESFKNSLCLYAFDLTSDWCHGEGTHLLRSSDTIAEFTFAAPLENTLSVMCYYEFDDMIRIDKMRTAEIASKS